MPSLLRSSTERESRIFAMRSTNSGQPISSRNAPSTRIANLHHAEFTGAIGNANAAPTPILSANAVARTVFTHRARFFATDDSHSSPHTAPAAYSIGYAGAK